MVFLSLQIVVFFHYARRNCRHQEKIGRKIGKSLGIVTV